MLVPWRVEEIMNLESNIIIQVLPSHFFWGEDFLRYLFVKGPATFICVISLGKKLDEIQLPLVWAIYYTP